MVSGKNLLFAMLAVAASAALPGTAFAEQPDKWVSYVESTGSQYVDTEITGRWNTKVECKVEWLEFEDRAFVASRTAAYPVNGRLYFCYCLNDKGEMYTAQDTGANVAWKGGSETWNCRFEKNRVYTYIAAFSATNDVGQATNTINVDGKAVWSKASAGVDTGRSLYIFANHQGGSAVSHSKARCYGLKIWQGPVTGGVMKLVRDFQPCMKDDRAGLYDAVTSNIFYSATSTDLVCDANSEVPDEWIDYVESTGDAAFNYGDQQLPSYIDTGIIGRSGTKVVGEFALLKHEDGCLVGSRAGNTRFYMVHDYQKKIACGYNTFHDNDYTRELGKRYGVETEFNAGSQIQKVWADGVTNTVYIGTEGVVDTALSMYVFACNVNGHPLVNENDSMAGKVRCYGLEIWQDGVQVRNFKPCLKNGVAGLFDTVSQRIFYSLGTPLGFNNVKSENRSNVVFVEYIESDGNNTLDTGVPARSGTRAKGEMAWTTEGDYGNGQLRIWNHETYRYLEESAAVFWRQKRAYLGARNVKANGKWLHFIHESDSKLITQYGSNGEVSPRIGGSQITLLTNTKYSFDVTLNAGSQTFEWDGVQRLSTNFAENVSLDDTLHLFSSSHWRWRSAARCYGLQIWQDGILVRDFKPCRVDGKGMLYDTIAEKLYRPSPDIPASRTGEVVVLEDEKPVNYVDYVESDGTIFVDTGVIGKSGTAAKLKMRFLEKTDAGFLESRKGGNRFYLWHNHTSGNDMGYGYGSWVNFGSAAINTDYVVQSSLAVGSQTITVNGTPMISNSSTANIDTGYNMYLFTCHQDGIPQWHGKARLYWLKLYQGGSDGSNMRLVRNFKPVRLDNGHVVLWDFVENKRYSPQSVTAPYGCTTFSAIGPDGAEILDGTCIRIR